MPTSVGLEDFLVGQLLLISYQLLLVRDVLKIAVEKNWLQEKQHLNRRILLPSIKNLTYFTWRTFETVQ